MSIIKNIKRKKEVVRRWHDEVWNQGKTDTIDELIADNYTKHFTDIKTRSEFKEYFAKLDRWNKRVEIVDMIAEGTKVAARLSWFEGNKITHHTVAYFRLVGGKIAEDWFWTREVTE